MRRDVAQAIMTRMRDHSAVMVDQASLVSHELIRVAILWHELWTEGLEEASRFYFAEHNPEGMFGVLEPLHDMIERVSDLCLSTTDPLAYVIALFGKMLKLDPLLCFQFFRAPKPCGSSLSFKASVMILR